MTPPLFDPTICSVASVPALDFDFVRNCVVKPPPPPIMQCPSPEIPIDPPTTPVTCPSLGADTIATITITPPGTPPAVDIQITNIDLSCADSGTCRYHVDFDFALPIPKLSTCPPTSATGHVTVAPGAPGVDITVTQQNEGSSGSGACSYLFDFDFTVPPAPCPTVRGSTRVTVGSSHSMPNVGVIITTNPDGASGCEFLFDFDFTLPAVPAAICPTIHGSAAASTTSGSEAEVHLTITRLRKPTPSSSSGQPPPTSGAATSSSSSGSIGDCEFRFDFDFKIPRGPQGPCPSVTAAADISVTASKDAEPRVNVRVTPGGSTGDGTCAAQFDFDFLLPIATGPAFCANMTASATMSLTLNNDNLGVDVNLTQTGSGSNCGYNLDFDFRLPRPPVESGYTGLRDVIVDGFCDNSGLTLVAETWLFVNGRLQA